MKFIPKISIIVPSFNQADYLSACLDSIIMQDYSNLEIIVMDGRSTDGSLEIIKNYTDQLAYWQSESDGGQTAAIISGFEQANGELLTWLNSDDILLPNALMRHAKAYSRHQKADVFYGDHVVIDKNGRVVEQYKHGHYYNKLAWLTMPYIAQPGTLFTKRIWKKVGGADVSMHCVFDYDLWYRFMNANARFVHVNGAVAGFRIHDESKGAKWLSRYAAEHETLKQRYANRFGYSWERKVARLLLVVMQSFSGAYIHTLSYRLLNQKRIKAYTHQNQTIY